MKNKNTGLSTIIIMLLTTISRLLGFVRVFVISFVFGAGRNTDILNLVFTIPNNLRKLLAEGSLSSAFIPNLANAISKKDESDKKLTSSILGLLLLINIPLVALSIYFAKPIIKILLAFKDEQSILSASSSFQIMIFYILFVSISALLVAVLNSNKSFIFPALSPIIFSVSVISSVLTMHEKYGIQSMSIGVFIGGIAQILVLLPIYFLYGYSIIPSFDFRSREFRRTMELWAPLLLSSFIMVINQQITMNFASALKEGSSTALSNAIVFFQLPLGIITNSIITVLFPLLSYCKSLGEDRKFSSIYQKGMSILSAFNIPITVFVLLYSKNLIAIALMHGKFDEQNAIDTANVLNYYILGLLPLSLMTLSQKTLFATQRGVFSLVVTIVSLIVDVTLSYYLKDIMGVSGLALAYSITCLVVFFLLLVATADNYFSMGKLFFEFVKIAVCIIPMIGIYAWISKYNLLMQWSDKNILLKFANISLIGIASFAGYFIVSIALNCEIAKMIFKKRSYFDEEYRTEFEIITKKEEDEKDFLE